MMNLYKMEDIERPQNNYEHIQKHIHIYEEIVRKIYDWLSTTEEMDISKLRREFYKKYYAPIIPTYRIQVKKSEIIFVYRQLITQNKLPHLPLFFGILQKAPSRNISGVAVITVLTSPYPDGQKFSCKHNCAYCPNEPDQPRSYLLREPAVARANKNNFEAVAQMNDRLSSLVKNGHDVNKIELIIEGGTFTEYPIPYLERFFCDLYYACNVFQQTTRTIKSLYEEQQLNETSNIRVIGICIETRPDVLFMDDGTPWIHLLRKWGVTRIQLGVQHTNNDILRHIKRGHTIEDVYKAMTYLKNHCYKIDIHAMPDLPNSTPEIDRKMLHDIFHSPHISPDQVKIYPCQVVPWTIIEEWNRKGLYTPYAETQPEVLREVIGEALSKCPPYIRVPRVLRDIPTHYIQSGYYNSNLRQQIQQSHSKHWSAEMREREYGRHTEDYSPADAVLTIRKYVASQGFEYFISFESSDKKCLFGFLRLRIPDWKNVTVLDIPILRDRGLIRELHVYGDLVPFHKSKHSSAQHNGFGRRLIREAENITYSYNLKGTAIISGIGVKQYYVKHGYIEDSTYMIKNFYIKQTTKKYIVFAILCCILLINYIFYM
jgi:ELP3 family radical SAM enzyme/protein acetyltransferase